MMLAGLVSVLEGASYGVIRLVNARLPEPIRRTGQVYAEQRDQMRMLLRGGGVRAIALDSALGWRYRPGFNWGQHQLTAQGLRGSRLYGIQPPPGVTRVAAFGDSFVYGNEVATDSAWPAAVEAMFPALEVLNYGVGGYGVDQAYLRFLSEGRSLEPCIVLMGFTPDDLGRVVNVYRRFRSNRELPMAKPRFELTEAGELLLLPNPLSTRADFEHYIEKPADVRTLGTNDYWYSKWIYQNPLYDYSATVRLVSALWVRVRQRYVEPRRLIKGGQFNPEAPAFKTQILLFRRFADSVRSSGAAPALLFLPDAGSVAAQRRGRPVPYGPLREEAARLGLPVFDAIEAFGDPAGSPDRWFEPGGHYSPRANRLLASWLGPRLLVIARADGARCRPAPN